MSFKCPHCGNDLEVMKSEDLTKAEPVGQPEGDLSSGIVKATEAAIEKKLSAAPETSEVLNSLEALNSLANGSLGESDSGLSAGWSGAMFGALKSRNDKQEQQSAYDPEEIAKADPENLDKDAVAKTVQNMIHGALCKDES